MTPNFNSSYLDQAGTTCYWHGRVDTPENYKKNLKEKPDLMAKNGWDDTPSISYTFNSHGFRCDEFTTDPTIMFLGCSLTYGTALPIDVGWAKLVASKLGLKSANLGQEGSSADTAFRLCLGWIDRIQPKIVVYLKPPRIRWELIYKDTSLNLGTHSRMPGWVLNSYIEHYVLNDNNDFFNDQKNTMGIENICRSRNIPVYIYDADNDLLALQTSDDRARDCLHPGVLTNHKFAQRVIEDIQNG